MWEMMTSSVISRPIGVTMELNIITKIRKYRRLHDGHHFIPMAMEVHNKPKRDMDCFIKDCARFFHNRQFRGHLSWFFYIQFFKQCVSITLQHALTFVIERKIMFACDVCSKPPITIRSHDLHTCDIKGVVGEIPSYHERD
jgi:hypothetical protein